MEIRSIHVGSAAKVLGTTYALIGAIVGILSSIAAAIRDPGVGAGGIAAGGLATTILLIIAYALAGLIIGVLTAVFYNIVASVVGGIRITTR